MDYNDSGIKELKKIEFESPISGGLRSISIVTDWASNGVDTVCSNKVYPFYFYCFRDELTKEVVNNINMEIMRIASEKNMEPIDLVFEGDYRALCLSDVKEKVSNRITQLGDTVEYASWWFTGFGPMVDRIR